MLFVKTIVQGFLSKYQDEAEEAIKPLLEGATISGTLDAPSIDLPNLKVGQILGPTFFRHECNQYSQFKEKMDTFIEANEPGRPISDVYISKGSKSYRHTTKKN